MSDNNVTVPNKRVPTTTFEKRATAYIPPAPTLSQDTLPMSGARAIPSPARPSVQPPAQPPIAVMPQSLPARRATSTTRNWLWVIPIAIVGALALIIVCGLLVVGGIYGRGVLSGVMVGDIRLGGLSVDEATRLLNTRWGTLTLREGNSVWQANPSDLGLELDAQATAQQAYTIGRTAGSAFGAIFGRVDVEPVARFDIATAELYLVTKASDYSVAPINAGVALIDGNVQATPPQNGAQLDVQGTLALINANPGAEVADGIIDLVTTPIQPDILDASSAVEGARALLTHPLEIRVYDPVTDDSAYWSIAPEQWGQWLTAIPDSNSPIGLALIAQDQPLRDYLNTQAATLDPSRSLDVEAGVASIQNALAQGNPSAGFAVIKHNSTQYTVQAGETLTSIAWDFGMPYLYIQNANGGRDTFGVGETITIPPADSFLLYPVVPNKRIIVSITEQRVRVFENGQLIQDWATSTGISDSPTWKGVYQVISHEINAYAGNWNLYMPYFIGVYQPIPNAEFTNGFHGFPTRGGGQILWENSLGTKVTFGCILLNNQNAKWLYDWAETGVVVEIQG